MSFFRFNSTIFLNYLKLNIMSIISFVLTDEIGFKMFWIVSHFYLQVWLTSSIYLGLILSTQSSICIAIYKIHLRHPSIKLTYLIKNLVLYRHLQLFIQHISSINGFSYVGILDLLYNLYLESTVFSATASMTVYKLNIFNKKILSTLTFTICIYIF